MVDGTSSLIRPGLGNSQTDKWLKLTHYKQGLQDLYAHFAFIEKNLLKNMDNLSGITQILH